MNMIQYSQTNGIEKGMQVSESDGKVLEAGFGRFWKDLYPYYQQKTCRK